MTRVAMLCIALALCLGAATALADAVRKTVTWRGNADVSALAGQTVRVRLVVGDGELYSFGFTDQAP